MKIEGLGKIVVLLSCCIVVFTVMFFCAKTAYAEGASVPEAHLLINEVYPCPSSDETEWIELYNPTNTDILLKDYFLASKHGSLPEEIFDFTLDSKNPSPVIKANSFFIAAGDGDAFNGTYNSYSDLEFDNIILANSSDYVALRLKDDSSDIDAVSWGENYKNTSAYTHTIGMGHSIERVALGVDTDDCSEDFQDRKTPSPGAEYQEMTTIGQDEIKTIEAARETENGQEVTIFGTVTVSPGILSTQYFYIQDETGGIQVYCYHKEFPDLLTGDQISVTGELSETNNERRIKITSADKIVIQNHTPPIVPLEMTVSDIGETEEGVLIKTSGIVTETSGDTFYISDGQKEIKVIIKASTNIDKPKMKKGDEVEVSGIVSQYKDEYRILPIDQDDVKIVASGSMLPRAGISDYLYFILSAFSILLWNIYLAAKKKLLELLPSWQNKPKRGIFLL